MKKTNSVSVGLIAMFAAGFVLACATVQMAPMRISVSLWDIAVATWQGHQNPAMAAFMSNLDDAGEQAYGEDVWLANNFVGDAILTTSVAGMTGGAIIRLEKPCDQKAVDALPPVNSSSSTSPGGGTIPNPSSGATRWGIIGYNPIWGYRSVCTAAAGCVVTGFIAGYEAVYGPIFIDDFIHPFDP